mgnify:FL=1
MKKIVLIITILMSFNLLAGKYIGGVVNEVWYAWYDGTFSGKEDLTTGCDNSVTLKEFGMSVCIDTTYFKNLELTLTDITMKDNIINLKASDFKLTDKENNIYTPNNYPTKDEMKIYPNIYIDKNSFEKWLKANRGNIDLLKNINQKMKNSTKLKFSSNNTFLIYSNTDGKNIYLNYISEEAISEKAAEYTVGFVGLKLAQMYHLQENYGEAEKNYLIAAKKGNIEAMTNLSAIYAMQKKYDEAEKLLLKAIEGNDSFAYNNLGSLYLTQNKYDKAKIYFLKAIERGYTPAIINLGFLSIELKDYPNAKKYFKMAADLGNEEAQRIYREMLQNGY